MWPLPKIDDRYVGIVCTPTALTLSHLGKKGNRYCVKAYSTIALEHGELDDLVIYNPTLIKKYTDDFLYTHHLTSAFIAIAYAGPTVQEQTLTASTASPTRQTLQTPEFKKSVWDYCYLYPKETDHLFYACGIRREYLAQFQLLFSAAHLNLVSVTTEFMALLRAYKSIHGHTFRHGQLARDMELYGTHLEKSISRFALEQKLHIPAQVSAQETDHAALVTSLGLFLTGSEQ